MTLQIEDVRAIVAVVRRYGPQKSIVAKALDVTPTTITTYCRRFPEVREAFLDCRRRRVDRVENRLYKCALKGESWAVRFFLDYHGYGHRNNDKTRSGQLSSQAHPPQLTAPTNSLTMSKIAAKLPLEMRIELLRVIREIREESNQQEVIDGQKVE